MESGVSVTQRRDHSNGAERARRLAELAAALEDARNLLDRLAAKPSPDVEIPALIGRVADALAEVDALRRGNNWPTGRVFGPKRTRSSRNWLDRRG